MTARGAALILLGACVAPPSPAPQPPTPPAASGDAVSVGDHAMIQLIQELVALLSNEVTFEDVTHRLGPVANDPGAPQPAALTPRDGAIRHASVVRYPDSGKPYTVELELATAVPVASLVAAFGAYRQSRSDRGLPRSIFFPPAGTGPWKIVLLAELPPGTDPLDDGATTRVTLRRDPP